MAWLLSKLEGKRAREPNPCLHRLLLLFWAHYIRMVLIYYALVHAQFTVGDYLLQTTKERMLLITSKRMMLQIKGKSG